MIRKFSLHKIQDEKDLPFSAHSYSRFKFGCKTVARQFGHELGDRFTFKLHERLDLSKQIVVCSSPYCFIPTATFAMKDYFIQKLNEKLMRLGKPVVQETKIHRTITYKEDYGGLSADERMKLIGNDGFHIDKSFVEGKIILFLDDIRITGSHEKVILRMCEQFGLTNEIMFIYYAELTNTNIHPKIENDLNYAAVTNLIDLDRIIKNENFLLNTRTVKFILNSPMEQLIPFIQYQSVKMVRNIYHQSIGNSYHMIDDYKENFKFISQQITDNQYEQHD